MASRNEKPGVDAPPDPAHVANQNRKAREQAVQAIADRNHRAHKQAKSELEARQRTLAELRKGLEF